MDFAIYCLVIVSFVENKTAPANHVGAVLLYIIPRNQIIPKYQPLYTLIFLMMSDTRFLGPL